jgi:hypothetical protein
MDVHRVSAFTLLGCTYVFFAIHLRQNLLLMLIHLSAPIVLAVVTGFESYGIWQKALISYFRRRGHNSSPCSNARHAGGHRGCCRSGLRL